ncbi:MAG: glycosyltransferase family 4 protein [Bacteroidetes bacterium]|nr:glycosyltransferase family 4 protein [Bacteroidota bacterium]MBS1540083.1 glycosyltransferase family 4 protein [Bacteroidota bacterium]
MHSFLFDCERMKYPNTGPYQVCQQVGRKLLLHKNSDEHITFFVPKNREGFFGNKASYYTLSPLNKIYLPWRGSRLLLNTHRYDVWHITYQSSMYVPLAKKTKVVLTILDLNFLHEHPNDPKNKKRLQLIQDRVDRADHITSISDFALNEARSYLNFRDKPSSTNYIGYDFEHPPQPREPNQKPGKPFLFALGTILPKKNFHVLPCLLQGNDFDLLIAGISKTDYKEQIIAEAKRFGVSARVKFLGAVSEEEKTWYYKNCEAFLFPSIAEGFGLPAIEAMNQGKPVFLSTHTSLPEIGGSAAYYFADFAPEAMQKVFSDGLNHFYREQPQEKNKQWAMQFDWSNTAKGYLNIYRSLLK